MPSTGCCEAQTAAEGKLDIEKQGDLSNMAAGIPRTWAAGLTSLPLQLSTSRHSSAASLHLCRTPCGASTAALQLSGRTFR